MTRFTSEAFTDDEWQLLGPEEQARLTRLALLRMKELLSSQRPLSDHQERDLQLRVAQSALANASRAKMVLERSDGLIPLDGVLQEIVALGTKH
jgi:hypothetical protein